MGVIVLDAGIVIAALDGSDAHHEAAVEALRDARAKGDTLVLPASAYAESLVGPSRRGSDAIATVDAFVDALPAAIEPATRAVAREAARLRAVSGSSLRLPDAIVLATAQVMGAELVLTTDAGWPAMGIEVTVVGSSMR
jgi:predicted nucleic acid-binding protein